jgi:short subunit dehydrogenase-like uncharacterized protein
MASIQTIHIDARSVPQNTIDLIQAMVKNAMVQVSEYAPSLSSNTLIVTACREMADKYKDHSASVCFISTAINGLKQSADIASVMRHIESAMPLRRAA